MQSTIPIPQMGKAALLPCIKKRGRKAGFLVGKLSEEAFLHTPLVVGRTWVIRLGWAGLAWAKKQERLEAA